MSGPELALRAAVNASSTDISSTDGKADSIKDSALQRLQTQGSGNASPKGGALSGGLEAAAIGAAVIGIGLAYDAIKTQLNLVKEKRIAFSKELAADIASYIIFNNEEERNVSKETKAIKDFLAIKDKYPSFSKYLGIHSASLTPHGVDGEYYSVLPFYKMSEALGQPLSSTKPLDKQRMAINLFFRTSGSEAFTAIAKSYNDDWRWVVPFKSFYQGENYLNSRRAPRFIMMCLLNLLWNLQHPVDKDGFPLGPIQCIEICKDVTNFITELLVSGFFSHLLDPSHDEYGLAGFMSRFEKHIKMLGGAYSEEHLHEVNIDDITTSAHRTLRIMDTSVFKLIFKKRNPDTGKEEPDSGAANSIADKIGFLNILLRAHPDWMRAITAPEWITKPAGINTPPTTTVDLLIILCHLSTSERESLFDSLREYSNHTEELITELKIFHERFVKPVREVCKVELKASPLSPRSRQEVSTLTARRLMPLLTLVIEDYRTDIDTEVSYNEAKKSQSDSNTKPIYNGKQQVQNINATAYAGGGYYTWSISSFADGATELDDMVKYQYRLTRMTKLLDSVSEIVKNYRSYLMQPSFIDFLQRCLTKVKIQNADLAQRIKEAERALASNDRISRSLQAILRPLTSDLARSLESYDLARSTFENVVSDPSFPDQQKELLTSKLSGISTQFTALFEEASGLEALIDGIGLSEADSDDANEEIIHTPVVEKYAKTSTVLALRSLVQECFDAMSLQSRQGNKGLFLLELQASFMKNDNLTQAQVEHAILELTRATACYRETWFFQAAYGETRSAQVLRKAIQDPILNKTLPLAATIFNRPDIDVGGLTDTAVLQRFRRLREEISDWQESADTMKYQELESEAALSLS